MLGLKVMPHQIIFWGKYLMSWEVNSVDVFNLEEVFFPHFCMNGNISFRDGDLNARILCLYNVQNGNLQPRWIW